MRRRVLLVALVVGLVVLPAGAFASVQGQPNISVYLPDNEVTPGQETSLGVQIMNSGSVDYGATSAGMSGAEQRVTTARGVQATLKASDAPIDVKTGTLALGSLTDGAVRTANFDISVHEDAKPGTYRIPVRVEYDYTNLISERSGYHQELEEDETVYVKLKVEHDPQFEIISASSDAPVGDSGTISLTMQNIGSETAQNARVSVQSLDQDVVVGSSGSASRFVGEWASGENRTIDVKGQVSSSAETRNYSIQSQVSYENEEGQTESSEAMTAGITPAPEQAFSLSNVQSTLRVGEEGDVTMTVTNEGPESAHDAVLRLSGTGQNVHPQETEYALGTFETGASEEVSFPIEISGSSEAGPRQLSFTLAYQNADGESRQSDPLNTRVPVEQKRDQFVITPVNASLSAGGSTTVTLEVTNNGEETVQDVNAKIFADDPLSTSDDEAFVQSLGPGESKQMTFTMAATGGALAKTYPLSMDFQYDVSGESKLSKTYQVPIDVTKPESGGLPITAIGGLVIVVLVIAGGAYWYTQR